MTVLVIDVGSSSVRALLFDEHAGPVPGGVASRSYRFTDTPPGAAVVDPDRVRNMVEACIDDVLVHPAAAQVEGVGMATFVGSVVGLDAVGQPVTPLYTYGDTRSAPDLALLRPRLDVVAAHQRTGTMHHTAYLPARLHWLRRTEPALFASVGQWVDIGTYLYRCWFGDAPCSYSVASWNGMLNRARLEWDREWIAALEISPATLPALADYDAVQTGLRGEYASRWSTLANVPFCLAVGDGAAANIGVGAVGEDRMALTVGTTAALRVMSEGAPPPVPRGLWGYRLDESHHLIGGATFEGGSIFRWARDVLALPDAQAVEQALASAAPDAHGLTVLPLFGGERSPGWAADATGSIVGLRLSTTPLDMMQAALEGVALRLSLVAEQLDASDVTVMAGGGALVASPAWTQMIANALNRPLHLVDEAETTARGVVLLVRRALYGTTLDVLPPAVSNVTEPDPAHAEIMRRARERQKNLYRVLINPEFSL